MYGFKNILKILIFNHLFWAIESALHNIDKNIIYDIFFFLYDKILE